jgi:hypothetical protein
MNENTVIRELTADELLTVAGGQRVEACHARYLAHVAKYEHNKSFAENFVINVNYARAYYVCLQEGDRGIP